MRFWREQKALIIQPTRCRSEGNMADILSEGTKLRQRQVFHSRTARSFDEGQAISNHRLLAFDQERVTFHWKDYARGGKQGQMTLAATEFLRRFFLHMLPKGFVRIRHFGFLANRFRTSRLALSRQLLASSSATEERTETHGVHSEDACLWHCPRCGGSMIVIQRFTAAELSACTYFDSS